VQRDFTHNIYFDLITAFKNTGYVSFPYIDIISNGHICEKYVVMRHDVGKRQMAEVRSQRSDVGHGQVSEVGGHPGEMLSAVATSISPRWNKRKNGFHWAPRGGICDRLGKEVGDRGKDEKIRKSKVGMKGNAGIYLSACTSFRSILLFTAAAYLITLLRLGKGLPDSILATTDWVVPIRSAICFWVRLAFVLA